MTPDTSILTPAQATAAVRGAFDATAEALPFNNFLPNQSNPEGLSVSWQPNTRIEDDEAEFGAFDAEAPYGKEIGTGATNQLKLQVIRKRMRITEFGIIQNSGMSDDWKRDKLTEYFTKLGKEAATRLERAKVEALLTGKIALDENQVKGEYDFQRDQSLSVTLATGKKWSEHKTDPIKDLKGWSDAIDKLDGDRPTVMVTTKSVLDTLAEDPYVIKYAAITEADSTRPMIGYQNVQNVLAQYVGITSVLAVDTMYNEYLRKLGLKFKGGVKSFFEDGNVLLLPGVGGSDLGKTAIGPTAEAYLDGYEVGGTDRNGFVGVVFPSAGNQPGFDAYMTGTGLPVVTMANNTLAAKVF